MLKNVGSADRNIRIILGIAIIIVGIVLQSWWGLIGLLPLLTAGISFCPLYSVLGMSTRKK
jgi:type IV secretory pathway TrbD component